LQWRRREKDDRRVAGAGAGGGAGMSTTELGDEKGRREGWGNRGMMGRLAGGKKE